MPTYNLCEWTKNTICCSFGEFIYILPNFVSVACVCVGILINLLANSSSSSKPSLRNNWQPRSVNDALASG